MGYHGLTHSWNCVTMFCSEMKILDLEMDLNSALTIEDQDCPI